MIIKTRSLTESLENKYKLNESSDFEWVKQQRDEAYNLYLDRVEEDKANGVLPEEDGVIDALLTKYHKYDKELHKFPEYVNEAYEVELDDEIDAIMDDDTLSDEEKEEMIDQAMNKYNTDEKIELEESFIFMPIPDDDPTAWGLDSQEEFENEILSYSGKKIVNIAEATDGYFDLTFEDGVFLPAVAQNCIVHKTNESLNEDVDMPVDIYEKVFSYVRSRVANEGISNMMPDVASKVPEYNPEWFDDDWIIDDEIGSLIDKLAIKITDQLCGKYEYEV